MGLLYFLLVVLVLLLIVVLVFNVFGAEAKNKTIVITTATVLKCNQNETKCDVIASDQDKREIELIPNKTVPLLGV